LTQTAAFGSEKRRVLSDRDDFTYGTRLKHEIQTDALASRQPHAFTVYYEYF